MGYGSFEVIGEQIEVINDRAATEGPFAGFNYAQILMFYGQDPSVLNNFEDGKRSANGDLNENDTEEYVLTVNYRGWGRPPVHDYHRAYQLRSVRILRLRLHRRKRIRCRL